MISSIPIFAKNSGTLFITYSDWQKNGTWYLKDDLTFTTNKNNASKFYLLKSDDSPIINKDRITINVGNRSLVLTDNGLKFKPRETVILLLLLMVPTIMIRLCLINRFIYW